MMLSIQDLHVSVSAHGDQKEILRGLNLEVRAGEVHAIMGPNGSGKSTLAHVLSGKEGYQVTRGTVRFLGKDLLSLSPEERAHAGLFLGFQYPVEIAGVGNLYFLRTALNAARRARGEPELDSVDFLQTAKDLMKTLEMGDRFLERSVNEGFSGGEKKRNEILQMLVLQPKLALLDETDSGLDIDALRVVSRGISLLQRSDRAVVLVTHYQRLLDYVVPHHVHVLAGGRIVRSGDKSLALELEKKGYGWLTEGTHA